MASLLIIEDDKVQRFVFQQLCDKFDYSVEFSFTGEDALERLKDSNYDAIFMDVRLPGMSGIEVTRLIREHEKQLRISPPIPIIGMTASIDPADEHALREAGITEFLTKPFSIDNFRRLLLRQVYRPDRPNMSLLQPPSTDINPMSFG